MQLVSDQNIEMGGAMMRRRVYCLKKDRSQLFLRVREVIKVAPVVGPEPEPWPLTHMGPQTRAVSLAAHKFCSRKISSDPILAFLLLPSPCPRN